MKNIFSKTQVFLCFFLLVSFAFVLLADEKTDKVDAIFAEWNTTTTPGVALAVIKDGQIIYERGYGMAKIEDNIIMTPQKIFDIASNSKQFTAACLAILIQRGKIKLDDDIHIYFPEMPQYEKPILVKHLVYHTSGLRDYRGLLGLVGFRSQSDCPTEEESLGIIIRQKKLNFLPGEEFSYTNTGYFLIGKIIEKVSGQSLNTFAQENIFNPLGMRNTFFRDDHNKIIKNLTTGYGSFEKGYKLNMSNWEEIGDSGVYTSVEDLYFWDQAFYNDKLGIVGLMDSLYTVGELNNGKKLDYGFGLRIGEYKGLKNIDHGGAWAGYRTQFVRFPEQKFSVICLTNLAEQDPSSLCYKVADIYLADRITTEKRGAESIVLSTQELEKRIGNYWDQTKGMWASVSKREESLVLSIMGMKLTLSPISKAVFKVLDISSDVFVEFLIDDKEGSVTGVSLKDVNGGHDFVKVASLGSPLSSEELKEYAGEYVSGELPNTTYRFVVENGALVSEFRSAGAVFFKDIAKDKFISDEISLEFVRLDGKISGFKLNKGARVVGIECLRK